MRVCRGNARPYADVSMLAVHTYGKNAPKYKECLEQSTRSEDITPVVLFEILREFS